MDCLCDCGGEMLEWFVEVTSPATSSGDYSLAHCYQSWGKMSVFEVNMKLFLSCKHSESVNIFCKVPACPL